MIAPPPLQIVACKSTVCYHQDSREKKLMLIITCRVRVELPYHTKEDCFAHDEKKEREQVRNSTGDFHRKSLSIRPLAKAHKCSSSYTHNHIRLYSILNKPDMPAVAIAKLAS